MDQAKFECLEAAAAMAEAEAKAARAKFEVAKARFEYEKMLKEHGGSPQPSLHGSPRDHGASESSAVTKFLDREPAVIVATVATVPSQKLDDAGSSTAVPKYTASKTEWDGSPVFGYSPAARRLELDAAAELDGTTANRAALLGRDAPFPHSPDPPVLDPRGPFMEFGSVRIRIWYVCFAGGGSPCLIMTTDEHNKYDWSSSPVRNKCCAKAANHLYRQAWKSVMQIQVGGADFLTTIDAHNWHSDLEMYKDINRLAERVTFSEDQVRKEICKAQKFTFERAFRRAQNDEVKPCVDLQKTWFLKKDILLPDWSFDLLFGVVKHCKQT